MTIKLTLEEMLHRSNNWEEFCEDKGWSEWAVRDGGGDIEIELTVEEAIKYRIFKWEE